MNLLMQEEIDHFCLLCLISLEILVEDKGLLCLLNFPHVVVDDHVPGVLISFLIQSDTRIHNKSSSSISLQ